MSVHSFVESIIQMTFCQMTFCQMMFCQTTFSQTLFCQIFGLILLGPKLGLNQGSTFITLVLTA
jgi:hypothetical protein